MENWGIIFDLDGTMVDNKDFHQQAWIETCRDFGKVIDSTFYMQHIHARTNALIVQNVFGPDIPVAMGREIGIKKELNYRRLYQPHLREIPGLRKFLEGLKKQGTRCAVASNSPAENVELVLGGLGIKNFFQAIVCSDDVTKGKPDPEILITAAKRLDIDISRCIVFEDSPAGLKAAQNAGCRYVIIKAGSSGQWQAYAQGAFAIHNDFTKIEPAGLAEIFNK